MSAAIPFEHRIRELGREIFEHARAAQPKPWQSAFWMEVANNFATSDDDLKVRAFRWVDALPSMHDEADVAAHLKDYLDPAQVKLPAPVRLALSFSKADSIWGKALGKAAQQAASMMANRFITASKPAEAIAVVERMRKNRTAFTLDVLGEATISGTQADKYAQTYIDLIEAVGRRARGWNEIPIIDRCRAGPMPRANVSVKLTSLDTHFDPIDPDRAYDRVSARLRPILRSAQMHGAFVNIDMESWAVHDLTLDLFERLLMEPEFADWPDVGIVVQAYLTCAEDDLHRLLAWVTRRGTPIGIRLVKGAYWDHETVLAEQNGSAAPVWTQKWQSDVCYEKVARIMLENHDRIRSAFASHNVRTIAHVLACAEHLGLGAGDYEIQMLHGMGDPLKEAILKKGRCLRVYCPYGDMIAGMAYLVRRLLENSSNDSFLKQGFSDRAAHERLLVDPNESRLPSAAPAKRSYQDTDSEYEQPMHSFRNQTATSFADATNRDQMTKALGESRSRFGQQVPLVINGVGVIGGPTFDSVNPANPTEVVAQAVQATPAHGDQAVAAALAAFDGWKNTSAPDRTRILNRAADLLYRDHFGILADIVLETAKPWREADADLCEGIDYIRYYARRAQLMDGQPRRRDLPGEGNLLLYEPRGVCAVISPFNFPLALLAGMTSAALAVGNTVVIKPSSDAPLVASKLVSVFEQAGLPPGVINFLPGSGRQIGTQLVQHPDTHLIAFTGSTAIGLKLIEIASVARPGQRHVKQVVADMGGKNTTLIDGDAELDEAVTGVLASAFAYAGQRCSACSRVVVVADVYESFCAKLVEAAGALVVGPPEEPGTQVGPVINQAALDRIRAYIELGGQEGDILHQTNTDNLRSAGYYVGPTIIGNVDSEARVVNEEIFGPVLTVIKATDFAGTLKIANDSPYGLTGGVYSRSPAHLELARREFRVGNLYLNRKITGSRADIQPYGGFGLSGTANGKAGGPDYLLQFCVARTITENALRHGFAPTEQEAETHA